ncbi:undecaprenyl-diphosphate phosphatase [Candidatus Synechococcus calcipolaris G9]|uniref:Undecaprenyl-diphosphatase n=1 Tax=Candidatus Synechococcus calcipolaris G9 TaxID=1497997 RepID=A0ABT6F2G7_9SYNE|nr:undecaprenyl-diphosphate phosphatase [Candidatus Synechococcus calcipolaris]MDG2992039.1 undecaprenyl-diphosphate phosphatase [Candidatus Synechococcus calcipolaris G9]
MGTPFEWFQAIVLGLVQGITEFLPISSTAHLIIFTDIFGWKDVWDKTALDAIQFGSVIAVFSYFWSDIRHISVGAWQAWRSRDWQREEWKIFVGIFVGTIPALAVGYALKESGVELDSAGLIATMSLVMAALLALAEKIGSRKRNFDQLTIQDGILVGLGQTIALLPGSSRSGSTLTTALFLGLQRQTAARFSFLLGIPTLTIATLVQAKDVIDQGDLIFPLLLAIASTCVFSYLAIAWLLRYLQQRSTWVFVWYRFGLGTVLWLAIALGAMNP